MAESEIGLDARFLGPARLDGFALGFRRRSIRWGGGAADIVASPGGCVWGVLYDLPEEALTALDAKEGEGFAYRRREVTVEHAGSRVSAYAYDVIDKEPADVSPTPEYRALLLTAARERGLPTAYIRDLDEFGSHMDPKSSRSG
jgi:cation transport regulator ChaC